MTTRKQVHSAGAVTNDGSVVDIYLRLSGNAELEVIGGRLAPYSSVLDLGCGAGRITNLLTELGHRVVAVDDSADMLAHVRGAQTVQARIEELRLRERFDAVLLCSNLVNYPGTEFRRRLVATAAYHLKPAGTAIIQWRSPQWFVRCAPGSYQRTDGSTLHTMTILTNDGQSVTGEFVLEDDGQTWTQPFEAQRLSGEELTFMLDHAGMRLDTADPESAEWLQASLRP